MKLLIHAINGIGLGHVIRTSRIAEAFKRLRSDVDIFFVTNTKYDAYLKKHYKTYTLKKDTREVIEGRYPYEEYLRYNARSISKIMAHELPDAALFDCEFNKELLLFCRKNSVKAIYILRITTPDQFRDIRKYLALFDSVIVPHDEGEFPVDQRSFLRGISAEFVGPIIDVQDYPEGTTRKNVLITLGSGAGIPENRPLFSAVDSFLAYLRKHGSLIGHHAVEVDIVTGPFYEGGCDLSGFKVRRISKNLVRDMYNARVVISGAGYNTINEIIQTKTPAVVIPLSRRWEDQYQRAQVLERLGCIKIARAGILDPIRGIFNNWESYHSQFPPIRSGTMKAAGILSEVLHCEAGT